MKARLSVAISQPVNLKLWMTSPTGKAYQDWKRFVPGVDYEIPNDPLLLKDLQKQKQKKRYDVALESKLQELGVACEVEICPTCGGKKKFLTYHTVEVFDE